MTHFIEEAIAEMVNNCGDYLNIGDNGQTFWFAALFLFWFKAVSACTKIVSF